MSQQTMRGEIRLFKTKGLFYLVTGQSVALPIEGKEEQSLLTMIIGYSRSPRAGPWGSWFLYKMRGLDYTWSFPA